MPPPPARQGELGEQSIAPRIHQAGLAVKIPPTGPKCFDYRTLPLFPGCPVIDFFHFGQLSCLCRELRIPPLTSLELIQKQPGFVAAQAEGLGSVLHSEQVVIAEIVELLVAALLLRIGSG